MPFVSSNARLGRPHSPEHRAFGASTESRQAKVRHMHGDDGGVLPRLTSPNPSIRCGCLQPSACFPPYKTTHHRPIRYWFLLSHTRSLRCRIQTSLAPAFPSLCNRALGGEDEQSRMGGWPPRFAVGRWTSTLPLGRGTARPCSVPLSGPVTGLCRVDGVLLASSSVPSRALWILNHFMADSSASQAAPLCKGLPHSAPIRYHGTTFTQYHLDRERPQERAKHRYPN